MFNRTGLTGKPVSAWLTLLTAVVFSSSGSWAQQEEVLNIADEPLFLEQGSGATLMLVMSRNHHLAYEAYNDVSDLNGDGTLDVGYKPFQVDYFGLFHSFQCYTYRGTVKEFDQRENNTNFYWDPTSTADPDSKACSGANEWSGDFLNYLTTSRMDALRKVLYGGRRVTDTNNQTIIERSFVPQDGHSWGKEYSYIEYEAWLETQGAADPKDIKGYDVSNYSPLDQPAEGTRHLFASTTLSENNNGNGKPPVMRVLNDSPYRIWEWIAKERPVTGRECLDGSTGNEAKCEQGAVSGGSRSNDVPESAEDFDDLVLGYTRPVYELYEGQLNELRIDANDTGYGSDNQRDNYLTLLSGGVSFPRFSRNGSVEYQFAIDGDGAVDLRISGEVVGSLYSNGNDAENSMACPDTIYDPADDANTSQCLAQIFDYLLVDDQARPVDSANRDISVRHMEGDDDAGLRVYWRYKLNNGNWNDWEIISGDDLYSDSNDRTTTGGLKHQIFSLEDLPRPASNINDYVVRTEVCSLNPAEDENCKEYPSGNYKPIGLLQRYGEDDQILFGLLTGSYNKNLSGGVLRRGISSFSEEVDPDTGVFTNEPGIVDTLSKIRVAKFKRGDAYPAYDNCANEQGKPLPESNQICHDWGNPIAEMMYETLRYFAGKDGPRSEYRVNSDELNLPVVNDWVDPFDTSGSNTLGLCAKPNMMVISDVNPSYDTDELPGVAAGFGGGITDDLTSGPNAVLGNPALNVSALGDTIFRYDNTLQGTRTVIGESLHPNGGRDRAPTFKPVNSLGNIRGMPEEPTKQGGYYAASVAYYGLMYDLHPAPKDQKVNTYAVALASRFPQFTIQTDNDAEVTIIPFGKSVDRFNNNNPDNPGFQAHNTLLDFFVQEISEEEINGEMYTRLHFRVNFEDTEQGSDHDMDAIAEYIVQEEPGDNLTITVNSLYAAGGIIQHMGYIINGTTADGAYLVVQDCDTKPDKDVTPFPCRSNRRDDSNYHDYFLDVPPGSSNAVRAVNNREWDDNDFLPYTSTRSFKARSGGSRFEFLKDPLWFAAKWGSFKEDEDNANGYPDLQSEWDENNDGNPDNYFLATNAGRLKDQLEAAFEEVLAETAAAAAAGANSSSVSTDTRLYQSSFTSGVWTGEVTAYRFNPETLRTEAEPIWKASEALEQVVANGERKVYTLDDRSNAFEITERNTPEQWFDDLTPDQQAALTLPGESEERVVARLAYLLGDQSQEEVNGGPFRNRESLLGDIINSSAVYVGNGDLDWGFNNLSNAFGGASSSYSQYLVDSETRQKMVYVGANDGMLHGFDEATGAEVFSVIPNALFSELAPLSRKGYQHRYYVDGTPVVTDVYDLDGSGDWGTALVVSLARGGKGLMVMDVSDPANFSANDILLEITPESTNLGTRGRIDMSHLGHVVGDVTIAAMNDGNFYAVFGNGYNGDGNEAVLYLVNLSNFSQSWMIETGYNSNGRANGLSAPLVADLDGDRIGDVIYAGDLEGNMWKFDVSAGQPNQWDIAANGAPLFQAIGPDGNADRQPITSRPEAIEHPDGGFVVLFGTGRYLTDEDAFVPLDPEDRDINSFYGIRDFQGTVAKSDLTQHVIDFEGRINPNDPREIRTTDKVDPDAEDSSAGWYIDLVVENETNNRFGEKVIVNPFLIGDSVLFATLVPDDRPCTFGGSSWLMDMNAINGAMAETAFYDTNGDGLINELDTPSSGIALNGATLGMTNPLKNADGTYAIDSGGSDLKEGEEGDPSLERQGSSSGGRQAWRQLQ